MNFETIKNNYDKGLWSIALVKMAVSKRTYHRRRI